jgi:hypothetical protein
MVKTIIFLVEHLDYIVSSNDPMFPKYGKHHWEFAKFTYLGMQLSSKTIHFCRSVKVSLTSNDKEYFGAQKSFQPL